MDKEGKRAKPRTGEEGSGNDLTREAAPANPDQDPNEKPPSQNRTGSGQNGNPSGTGQRGNEDQNTRGGQTAPTATEQGSTPAKAGGKGLVQNAADESKNETGQTGGEAGGLTAQILQWLQTHWKIVLIVLFGLLVCGGVLGGGIYHLVHDKELVRAELQLKLSAAWERTKLLEKGQQRLMLQLNRTLENNILLNLRPAQRTKQFLMPVFTLRAWLERAQLPLLLFLSCTEELADRSAGLPPLWR